MNNLAYILCWLSLSFHPVDHTSLVDDTLTHSVHELRVLEVLLCDTKAKFILSEQPKSLSSELILSSSSKNFDSFMNGSIVILLRLTLLALSYLALLELLSVVLRLLLLPCDSLCFIVLDVTVSPVLHLVNVDYLIIIEDICSAKLSQRIRGFW